MLNRSKESMRNMRITKKDLRRIVREAMQLEMFDTGSAGDEAGGLDLEKKKELCKKAGGEWLSDDPSGKYGHCSKPIEEADGESAPFGSGMEKADLDPEEADLVGHT